MKTIEVQFDETKTFFEAVVENEVARYDGDRTGADYADSEPNVFWMVQRFSVVAWSSPTH
jgi:hypothetical protein